MLPRAAASEKRRIRVSPVHGVTAIHVRNVEVGGSSPLTSTPLWKRQRSRWSERFANCPLSRFARIATLGFGTCLRQLLHETGTTVRLKGVSYDVGRELGGNWRPVFDMHVVHRELEIIGGDLHCNAVRICGRDIARLLAAGEDALKLGLEVWLSPELWNKNPKRTLAYVLEAATAAESLRSRWPGRVVFSVGSELTLFMRGIIPGRSLIGRVRKFRKRAIRGMNSDVLKSDVLNEFLREACREVREVFHGDVTYAALIWEAVDWSMFDVVGIDHYRDSRVKDRYVEMMRPIFEHRKPVVVTEFGMRSYVGAESSGTLGFGIVSIPSMVLHKLPIVGHFVRTRLKGHPVRDESLQAREIVETLEELDAAGVDGAFVCTFVDYLAPNDHQPKYDLDMSALSIVKIAENRHGSTYPEMEWEPKEAFKAIADLFSGRGTS